MADEIDVEEEVDFLLGKGPLRGEEAVIEGVRARALDRRV